MNPYPKYAAQIAMLADEIGIELPENHMGQPLEVPSERASPTP